MIEHIKNKGIFIVHALKGYEYHEQRIITLFAKHDLSYELVTDGDPTLFTESLLKKYFVDDIQTKLSKGVLSCTLNHIFAYERIVERQIEFAIVFENDPFFLGDFGAKLQKLAPELAALPQGFIVSLENTTLTFPAYNKTKKGQYLYPADAGRMAGAYLIDLAAAKAILQDLETTKCHTVIDWWHNSLIDRGIVNMYWAHPPLVEQGSHNGQMSSVISSESKNVFRRVNWMLQKYYKTYIRRLLK
jgi:glycosyl transferase, family 25